MIDHMFHIIWYQQFSSSIISKLLRKMLRVQTQQWRGSDHSIESRQQQSRGRRPWPGSAGSSASMSWARRRRRRGERTWRWPWTPSWRGRRRHQAESERRACSVSSSWSEHCPSSRWWVLADHESFDRDHKHYKQCLHLQLIKLLNIYNN